MTRQDGKQKALFYTAALTDEDVLLAFPNSETWLTRRQIADLVWRKVTPSFVARLELLVGEGKLEKHTDDLKNGMLMFWYRKVGAK